MCRRYEIYIVTPVTADDTVANSLDNKLLYCHKLFTGKDLLLFGVPHSNQHPGGRKLIVGGFPTLFCSPYTPIPDHPKGSRFL